MIFLFFGFIFDIFNIFVYFPLGSTKNNNSLVFCLSYVFKNVPHSVKFSLLGSSWKLLWKIVYFIHSRSPCSFIIFLQDSEWIKSCCPSRWEQKFAIRVKSCYVQMKKNCASQKIVLSKQFVQVKKMAQDKNFLLFLSVKEIYANKKMSRKPKRIGRQLIIFIKIINGLEKLKNACILF